MSTTSSSNDTRRAVLGDLVLALAVGAGWVAAIVRILDPAPTFPLAILAVYAATGVLILRAHPPVPAGGGMGPANRVTLGRLVVALPLVGLLVEPAPLGSAVRWWIVGLGTAALILDGVDGWLARRSGTSSAFGARFDMETDAALLLVLSGLAWRTGAVGPWVLGIGALRYLFVAAGWVHPPLRGDLPPSLRRKTICVVQGIALLVCLGPIVPGGAATAVAAVALLLLVGSFAVDTRTLIRAAGVQSPAPTGSPARAGTGSAPAASASPSSSIAA